MTGPTRTFGTQFPGQPAQPRSPQPKASLIGDELSAPGRLIQLFRDSYAASRGRQWLQPMIMWWTLCFLRNSSIPVDWHVLTSPALAQRVTELALPPGHIAVHPTDQVTMNFGLWWDLMIDLTRLAYQPRQSRWRRRAHRLPGNEPLEERARRLGLRPWMSSATYEEIAGIARALDHVQNVAHLRQPEGQFMIQTLLPGLLTVDIVWLNRNPPASPVLEARHRRATDKWATGRHLTPLDHMYLRAGDLLAHVSGLPDESLTPATQAIVELSRTSKSAEHTAGPGTNQS